MFSRHPINKECHYECKNCAKRADCKSDDRAKDLDVFKEKILSTLEAHCSQFMKGFRLSVKKQMGSFTKHNPVKFKSPSKEKYHSWKAKAKGGISEVLKDERSVLRKSTGMGLLEAGECRSEVLDLKFLGHPACRTVSASPSHPQTSRSPPEAEHPEYILKKANVKKYFSDVNGIICDEEIACAADENDESSVTNNDMENDPEYRAYFNLDNVEDASQDGIEESNFEDNAEVQNATEVETRGVPNNVTNTSPIAHQNSNDTVESQPSNNNRSSTNVSFNRFRKYLVKTAASTPNPSGLLANFTEQLNNIRQTYSSSGPNQSSSPSSAPSSNYMPQNISSIPVPKSTSDDLNSSIPPPITSEDKSSYTFAQLQTDFFQMVSNFHQQYHNPPKVTPEIYREAQKFAKDIEEFLSLLRKVHPDEDYSWSPDPTQHVLMILVWLKHLLQSEKTVKGGKEKNHSASLFGSLLSSHDSDDVEAFESDDADHKYRELLKSLLKQAKNFHLKAFSMPDDFQLKKQHFMTWIVDLKSVLSTCKETTTILDGYPTSLNNFDSHPEYVQ